MTSWNRILLGLGTALALTGCLGKSEPQPVILGHVCTLSGPGRAAGEHAARGIRLAVEEADRDPARGLGRPLVVRHTDAHDNLEAFAAEAVRLVTINRVAALLGGTSAEEVEHLERARVPVVAPVGMRTRAMGEAVFLTGLSPAFQGEVLARFAAADLAATTAAVLADERCEEALPLAEAFLREFPAAVAKQHPKVAPAPPVLCRYSKDAKFEELAARVRKGKPGVLLVAGGGGLPELLAALAQPALPVLLGGAGDVTAFQANRSPGNPAYQCVAFVTEGDTPRARVFIDTYKKEFNENPDVHAALAFDATWLLIEGLRQASPHGSSGQLRDKLAVLKDVAGLAGPLTFGADQRLRRPAFVVRLEQGQARTVKRFDPEP